MRIRLEEIREGRNLRLEDLAEKIGVAISTVQRWEKQSMSIPSERLEAIADAYQCAIADIFDDGRPKRAGVPTEDELASMLATAEAEIPEETTIGGYPSAVAASLRAQLLRYSGVRASGSESVPAPSKRHASTSRSRAPTKRSAQG